MKKQDSSKLEGQWIEVQLKPATKRSLRSRHTASRNQNPQRKDINRARKIRHKWKKASSKTEFNTRPKPEWLEETKALALNRENKKTQTQGEKGHTKTITQERSSPSKTTPQPAQKTTQGQRKRQKKAKKQPIKKRHRPTTGGEKEKEKERTGTSGRRQTKTKHRKTKAKNQGKKTALKS